MIRYAACPVVIIKDQTSIKDFHCITFVTDGTVEQDAIAKKVKKMQDFLGLEMHILKVRTPYNWKEESQIKAQLENFAKRNTFENYTTHVVFEDYIYGGAIKFAEEQNSSLIIMGTHGRTGFVHLLSGSNAEYVVNQSTIPVMTFKFS